MEGGTIRQRIFGLILTSFLTTATTEAQPAGKPARIGYLTAASLAAMAPRTEAFRQGLRELGYVEGKDIIIEWRATDYQPNRMAPLAAELVNLRVDVIVSGGRGATEAAKKVTATIPIVMTQDSDPIADGFVKSLAQPGGNITGLSILSPELSGKRLEILREVVQRLSRVAVFGLSARASDAQTKRELDGAAAAFGVKLRFFDLSTPKDIETAFHAAAQWNADGGLTLDRALFTAHREKVTTQAVRHRLAMMYAGSPYPSAGGLMSYAVDTQINDRRAAVFVDKILKGTKPADIPVEQPTKFEFIVNLKAAKAIGLTIPPNVLARADRVIR